MRRRTAPIETKVAAASSAAAATGFVLWLIQATLFVDGEVPEAVSGIVMLVVPGAVSLIAGWFARHTTRPDLATDPPNGA